MSREFIDAIESGDNLEAEDEFKNSISSKVGDALEFRRKDIAQTFAGNDEVDEGMYVQGRVRPGKPAQSAHGAAKTMAATEKGITQHKRTADAERSFQRKMNPPKSKKEIAQSLPDGGSPAPSPKKADAGHQPRSRGAQPRSSAGPRLPPLVTTLGGVSKPKKPSKPFAKKDVWA